MNAPRTSRRRSRRAALLAVAALSAGAVALTAGGPAGAQQPPKPEATSPDAELAAAAAAAGGQVVKEPGGPVTSVGVPAGRAIAVDGGGTTPRSAAQAFVDQYSAAFGEPDPADLTVDRTTPMAAGGKAVHYQQSEGGVPVMAGELAVQVASGGKVRSAGGELSTGDPLDVVPDVDAATAAATAVDRVASDAGVDAALLAAGEPALWVYDPSLLDEPGARRLVWRLEVRSDVAAVYAEVLVDAHTDEVALVIDRSPEVGKNRQVCDNAGVSGANYNCPAAGVVRSEGQGATGITDVDRAYELSGATYDFYKNRFNRDSIDGAGMILYSTARACPAGESCPWENAFWDGIQMVYGAGFASADDVVAHELTHGVTEHESNLTYLNQSGAINESMSDIFGEFVDQTYDSTFDNDAPANRWQMGEDLPPSIGVIRNMADPTIFGDPDRMGSPNFYNGSADSGGVHTNSGVGNKAAFLITDGGAFNGQTITSLGITKAARIFYEVNTNILTSGSNYAALGNGLIQACSNVVGVDGITVADCTQVANAVTATEMVQPPPANDNFANATTISGTTGSTTGSTSFATRQTGEPCHGGSGCGNLMGTASIWFKFTAAGTGAASINTCNSNYDTLLGVYTGSAVNALTAVVNNDDGTGLTCSASFWSKADFSVTQGTTYYVAVDGYSSNKGAVRLNWTLPAAPAPTGVSGTVTEAGTGTPIANAMVAVLNTSTFSIVGGGAADGSGNYSAQVPAGSYFLYVIDPSGNHTAGFFGAPATVVVTAGTMVDKDPTMASNVGTIGGTITDAGNGTPLSTGWAVALNGSTGAPESAAQANGSGQFSRGGLRAGNHLVVYLDQAGAHRSEFFNDSPGPSGAVPVAVTGGTTSTANAALSTQSTVVGNSTLTGTVTESGTNAPLSGVLVIASRASDYSVAVAGTTNGSGQYSLTVTQGQGYKLQFVDPTGLHDMEWHDNQPYFGIANATTVNAPATTNAALDRRNGSIAGTVTDDTSFAAVSGAWVLAIGPSGIAGGTITAGNGSYTIAGLPAGAYRVTFVDPVGGRNQEYFDNSATYDGGVDVNVTGGGTATANAALHHP